MKEAIAPGYYVISVPAAPSNALADALVQDTLRVARDSLARLATTEISLRETSVETKPIERK